MPGVGNVAQKDAIKREILHQLCIQDMAHSELDKALPEDVSFRFLTVLSMFLGSSTSS